ncbi:MAG: hypothetical protein IPH32_07365 [Bacteroidetes bacterium]|nr:hypothetical protein [Bacteroidota bacterium]
MEAGEPPVILDTLLTKITKNQLQKFVFSRGYFDSKVRDSLVVDRKQNEQKHFIRYLNLSLIILDQLIIKLMTL